MFLDRFWKTPRTQEAIYRSLSAMVLMWKDHERSAVMLLTPRSRTTDEGSSSVPSCVEYDNRFEVEGTWRSRLDFVRP